MSEITYHLQQFDGPLELLLSLIDVNKIDIRDIEISLLLEQYMAYISEANRYNISLAAEFIEMASTLVYIKSRSLLPKNETEEDPKAELERQLAEYAKCKKNAEYLASRSLYGQIFFRDFEPTGLPKPEANGNYPVTKLSAAYANVIARNNGRKPLSPSNFSQLIATKFISVGSCIVAVLRRLIKKSRISFKSLFASSSGRSETVAVFLAVLELLRSGRIDTEEKENGEVEIVLNKGKKAKDKNTERIADN